MRLQCDIRTLIQRPTTKAEYCITATKVHDIEIETLLTWLSMMRINNVSVTFLLRNAGAVYFRRVSVIPSQAADRGSRRQRHMIAEEFQLFAANDLSEIPTGSPPTGRQIEVV